MTAFGAFAFLVITGALAVVAIKLSAADPLAVDGQIAETIEGDCVWRLEVPIRNDGDGPLTVIKFEVLIDARPTAFPYTPETVILQPGEHTTLDASRPMAPCPATPGDVEHGRLWLSWRDTGSSGNADILRVSF